MTFISCKSKLCHNYAEKPVGLIASSHEEFTSLRFCSRNFRFMALSLNIVIGGGCLSKVTEWKIVLSMMEALKNGWVELLEVWLAITIG